MKLSSAGKPDNICKEFVNKKTQITLRMLEEDLILIEGTAQALEFFGKLLLSVAGDVDDTGFEISPKGPGQLLFSPDASIGVYIHRLE